MGIEAAKQSAKMEQYHVVIIIFVALDTASLNDLTTLTTFYILVSLVNKCEVQIKRICLMVKRMK